ncbi:MAG: hypothetical protein PWQ16_47 [bacterium]|nr:MAG: hypothetical protein XD52_0309 [bacterium 42_11]MDK2870696.1 hypothetical protein [bacterium]
MSSFKKLSDKSRLTNLLAEDNTSGDNVQPKAIALGCTPIKRIWLTSSFKNSIRKAKDKVCVEKYVSLGILWCGMILISPGVRFISVASTIIKSSGFSLLIRDVKFSGAVPASIPIHPSLPSMFLAIHGPTPSSPRSSFPTPRSIFFFKGIPPL